MSCLCKLRDELLEQILHLHVSYAVQELPSFAELLTCE